jgi:hypothetical protein
LESPPFGEGLFNVAVGFIDHHILHIHQIVEGTGPSAWDELGWRHGLKGEDREPSLSLDRALQ